MAPKRKRPGACDAGAFGDGSAGKQITSKDNRTDPKQQACKRDFALAFRRLDPEAAARASTFAALWRADPLAAAIVADCAALEGAREERERIDYIFRPHLRRAAI
jgi:hypothetical protein